AVEQREDVFYLTVDEVREIAAEMLDARPPGDCRPLVAARQAEMAYYRTIPPPPSLGTPPAAAPPPPDTPLMRLGGKILGTPPQGMAEPDIVRGNAGSPGVGRGPAKVIRSLAEAAKLQPGDVLVTRTTVPAWTPLFARAAAI